MLINAARVVKGLLDYAPRKYGIYNTLKILDRAVRQTDFNDIYRNSINFIQHHNRVREHAKNKIWAPSAVSIELTHYCERRCADCYLPLELRQDSSLLHEKEVTQLVEQVANLGVKYIGLMGGETFSDQTHGVIEKVTEHFPAVTFYLHTNGDYIAQNGIGNLDKRHNIAYFVSTDGFQEDVHDRLRGRGSFSNVVKTFDQLNKRRKFTAAAITVRPENYEQVTSKEFLEFLVDMEVQIAHFMKLKSHNPDRNMDNTKYLIAMDMINSHLRSIPLFSVFGSLDKAHNFDAGFPYQEMYIQCDGMVRISKIGIDAPIGNWHTQSIQEIVSSLNNNPKILRRTSFGFKKALQPQ